MKKAIFTLAIGDTNPMYNAALLGFKLYAEKVDCLRASFIVLDVDLSIIH